MQFRFRQSPSPESRIVWVVALASIAEAMLQAVSASLDGDWPHVVLWTCGSGLLGLLAAWAETVKVERRE